MKPNPVAAIVKSVMKKHWKMLLFLMLVIVLVVFLSLLPPQILKSIIDDHLLTQNNNGLLNLAIIYLMVALFIGLFDFLKGAILTVFGQKITKAIRSEMMMKTERINILYFSANGSGSVVSRFTNDVEAINSMFTNGLIGIIVDLFKIVGIIISMALFDWALGLIALVLLPIIYGITRLFQTRMLQAQIINRKQIAKVNNHLTESLKNVQMIKSGSKETYMENKFTEYLQDHYETVEKVNFYDSIFPPVMQIVRAFVIGLVIVLAAPDLQWVGITLGMVAASVELLSNLFVPIETLGMELQSIQQSISGVQRVNEFLKEVEEQSTNLALKATDVIPDVEQVSLTFEDVSFQYVEGFEVLNHITLTIKPKEKVTFVGRTGVGKTTLFKLCMGLLKPNTGRITINGIDVTTIPNAEKRKIFGYVDQSFHFIKGTISDQISLQDPSITERQIIEAVDFVGLMDYIDSLPNGLATPVLNDTLFSQGQKQLLAIARAIVTNPPILLLDEITANLDSITEEKIVSVLQKTGSVHTVLSITHRLSSATMSDTVVILENGRIKNSGSPETLMASDEWYRSRITLEQLTWK